MLDVSILITAPTCTLGVHAVQDWLTSHPSVRTRIRELANIGHMSQRSLTRAFRKFTGISILDYRTRLSLEQGRILMHNPELTLDSIAAKCGFADACQFPRLWRKAYRTAPSRARRSSRT